MLDRRQFLTRSGAAAIAAGALGGAHLAGVDAAEPQAHTQPDALGTDGPLTYPVTPDPAARLPPVAFHGPWQAGIVNPAPPAACFVSFNVTATSSGEHNRREPNPRPIPPASHIPTACHEPHRQPANRGLGCVGDSAGVACAGPGRARGQVMGVAGYAAVAWGIRGQPSGRG